MKILKSLFVFTMAILVGLCLLSCNQNKKEEQGVWKEDQQELQAEKTVSSGESNGEKNYGIFLTEFEKEGLGEYGIDAKELLADYLNDVTDITSVEYEVIKCNLTGKGNSDLFLSFCINHEWSKNDEMIVCAYTLDENGQYKSILFENHNFTEGKLVEILDNGSQQLVLRADDTGNNHTKEYIKIFDFHENGSYNIIFDEVLCAYGAFPFKSVTGEQFYSVSYDNHYEFIEGSGNAKDIVFKSEIYEREDEILKSGSSHFVYNGEKYVAISYYDYEDVAKGIYDNKQ